MSDDLAVGGPGATSVLTTELVEESNRLTHISWQLESCHREVCALDSMVGRGILGAADAPQSAFLAEEAIDEAVAAIRSARETCDNLARGLSIASDRYDATDRAVAELEQHASAGLAHLLGAMAPLILGLLISGGTVGALASVAFFGSLPEPTRAALFSSLRGMLRNKTSMLSDPNLVTAVRYSVMSVDDAGWGLAGVPPLVAQALGDEGLGIFGVDTSAGVIAGAASGLGLLRESRVRIVAQTTRQGISSAETVQERAKRIPRAPDQVRIDRYSTPGLPDRFEVYIAGTEDISLTSGDEPWDMASNVAALAGGSDGEGAGSYRAVALAMQKAGIADSSPVTFTGYSQGGLIAAQLAASGDYAVDGLITFGAPAGHVSVPHDIAYVAIEHNEDLVPALGGTFTDSNPTLVRRTLFDATPSASEVLLPAHQFSNYLDTAKLIDRSTNIKLGEVLQRLDHPRAETVSSTIYRAERVQQQ